MLTCGECALRKKELVAATGSCSSFLRKKDGPDRIIFIRFPFDKGTNKGSSFIGWV